MTEFEKAKSLFDDGVKFYQKGDFESSKINFEDCLKIAPTSQPTLENLSKTYIELGDLNLAEEKLIFLIGLKKEKDNLAYKLLFKIYSLQNNFTKLEELSKEANSKRKFNEEFSIRGYLFYPSFFNSLEDIKSIRTEFSKKISNLSSNYSLPQLDISKNLVSPPNFELSYDGNDNLEIYKNLIKVYEKIYPEIRQLKDYEFSSKKNEKIKIGFISEYFTDHTIMKLFRGIIYKLNKQKFEVYVFHSDKTRPGSKFREINENVILYDYENIILPIKFNDKVDTIRSKNLDLLFYPDVHMSANLYYLTLIKLAKYHIASWGHPETTGNSNIDFFLSSKLLESEGYEKNYSEKVLMTNYLPMYFYKPKIHYQLTKEQLSQTNIYFCGQSLIKMHPIFDTVINKILNKDKKAEVTFIKSRNKHITKQFIDRLKKNINNNFDRIKFIERLETEEYINKCGSASVLLDTYWFGSGNSFHESMYYGTPTITLPTKYLKSRVVTGAYKQMKIENAPIANDIEEYVEKSVEYANYNANKALELKSHYKNQANKYLYENENIISDMENIFESILNKN